MHVSTIHISMLFFPTCRYMQSCINEYKYDAQELSLSCDQNTLSINPSIIYILRPVMWNMAFVLGASPVFFGSCPLPQVNVLFLNIIIIPLQYLL